MKFQMFLMIKTLIKERLVLSFFMEKHYNSGNKREKYEKRIIISCRKL